MANRCPDCKKYVKTQLSDDGWIVSKGLGFTDGTVALDIKAVLFLKCADCGVEVAAKRFAHTLFGQRNCTHSVEYLALEKVSLKPQEELVSRAGQFPLKNYNALLSAIAHCKACGLSVDFGGAVKLPASSFTTPQEVSA